MLNQQEHVKRYLSDAILTLRYSDLGLKDINKWVHTTIRQFQTDHPAVLHNAIVHPDMLRHILVGHWEHGKYVEDVRGCSFWGDPSVPKGALHLCISEGRPPTPDRCTRFNVL